MIQKDISVKIFETLETFLFTYGGTVFENTAGVFLGLFMAFYGIKITWNVAYKSLAHNNLTLEDVVVPLIVIPVVTIILGTSYYMETWIVYPFYKTAVYFATVTATTTSDLPYTAGIGDMLGLVDMRLNEVVFNPSNAVAKLIGWKNMYLHVGIWIIQGLYVFVWFLFLALMIEALFRFMTFFAISPLIITMMFSTHTKPIAVAGFRSLAHGILSMFMAGVAMGMTIAVIGVNQDLFVVDGKLSADWVFSESYFTLILIALVSISFHLKAPKIAANLANIDDGPGAAAAVAGLGTAAVMSGKAAMGRMGGRVASAPLNHAGKKAGKGYDKMWEVIAPMKGDSLYSKMTGK